MVQTATQVTYETFTPDPAQADAFVAAVDNLAPALGAEHPFFVNGEPREGDGVEEEVSPSDRRVVLGRFAKASLDDFDAAVTHARRFSPEWAATPWEERVRVVQRVSGLVAERRYELAAILAHEIGKPVLEALGEVDELIVLVDYYCRQMAEHGGFAELLSDPGASERAISVMRPHGVWVVIGPFNFPMALGLGPIAAALIAGNTVVFKPSPLGYWSGLAVHDLFRAAGVPDAALQTLTIPDDRLADRLYARDDIDGLTFTGSYETGMRIYRGFVGRYPRPIICEMGGKNAAIVTANAELRKAALGVTRSAFGFSGQRCSGCSRVLVAREVHDEFVELLKDFRARVNVGSPADPSVQVGPVVTPEAAQRLVDAAEECRSAGWRVHGGDRLAEGDLRYGNFVEPTVAEVPSEARVLREELFTPFVAVRSVESLDEALVEANDLVYGLTAGVFSEDGREVEQFLERIHAGVVYVNREAGATTGAWPGVQPFGGWKGSGTGGRGAGGPHYLQQYLREQSRTIVGRTRA